MKKFLLKLLMGASLTASVFLFQACYGAPPPYDVYDIPRGQTPLQETVPDSPETVTDDVEAAGEEEITKETLD